MSPLPGVIRRPRSRLGPIMVLGLVCLAGLGAPSPTRAQGPAAELELVSQPPWHEPREPLNLSVRVTNTGEEDLEGYGVRLRVYSSVEGRIELHESFDGVDEIETFSLPGPEIPSLEPGKSEEVVLKDDLADLGISTEGVFPITVSLVDEDLSTEIGALTTQVVFYPKRPEDPLNLVPVIPLAAPAFKGPGGEYTESAEGKTRIAEALDPDGGWLRGVIDSLLEATADPSRKNLVFGAGLAPSPRLLEELGDAAAGYSSDDGNTEEVRSQARQALDDLSTLMTSERIQPLLSPYASVDLPTLASRFDQEDLNRQLSEANVVLENAVPDVAFDPRWFFSPGLRWDEGSLADVRISNSEYADHTFFTRHSISGSTAVGCPDVDQLGYAFACPVEVTTEGRPITGFVADPGVQERLISLTRTGEDRVDLQRFFAETAMIHLEQPGTPERVIQMSIPSQLQPRPAISKEMFESLADAPWLTLLKPIEGLDVNPKAEKKELIAAAPELSTVPDDSYFEAITDARAAVKHYEEINPPPERVRRLYRNILVAQSRVWWSDEAIEEGVDFALRTQQEAQAELDKIFVEGLDTTLTSQTAPVELTVFNDNSYPVTVDVELSSDDEDISIRPEDLEELQDLTIGPEDNERITVDAEARSSGIFQLDAVVKTPQNGFGINEKTIEIRSTNFNRIALGLTFGALAFLVLFYVMRWFKRRGDGTTPTEQVTA